MDTFGAPTLGSEAEAGGSLGLAGQTAEPKQPREIRFSWRTLSQGSHFNFGVVLEL